MKNKFKIILFVLILFLVAALLLQISRFTVGNSPQKSDKTFSDSLLIPPNPDVDETVPPDTTEDIGDIEVGTENTSVAPPPKDDMEMLP